MDTDAMAVLVLVFVAALALVGLWTVLGYTFENGLEPQVWPGKAFLYPETMKISAEVAPEPIRAKEIAKSEGNIAIIKITRSET